jgi:hypothetical protein
VHISVASALRGMAGGRGAGSRTATGGQASQSAMEAVASLLGPPQHKFRPPCRMQDTSVQTPELIEPEP